MIDERSRGFILYTLAGLVLVAGGTWYLRSDPLVDDSPQVAAWRELAERSLPDLPLQATAETVVLSSGGRVERRSPIEDGPYILSVVCAGLTGQVRVWLGANESGRAVPCSEETPAVNRFPVALVDELQVRLAAENDTGGAVFRWRLERSRGF